MTVNDAVVKRIEELLNKKGMTQYRLEQLSGIQHGHMQWIMSGRSKTVTLSTVIRLANGFGMTLVEFLNNDKFLFENLEVE
ncbi:MAG: helix-turn-helix transcriptional regulator [Clostridia bacterium]|nr:helix-turn-helix transcriptional regulator [Clostridia bacterium]